MCGYKHAYIKFIRIGRHFCCIKNKLDNTLGVFYQKLSKLNRKFTLVLRVLANVSSKTISHRLIDYLLSPSSLISDLRLPIVLVNET